MTKRNNYRDPIPRCCAQTQSGNRCTRDAKFQHDGRGYCDNHHAALVVIKTVPQVPRRSE